MSETLRSVAIAALTVAVLALTWRSGQMLERLDAVETIIRAGACSP